MPVVRLMTPGELTWAERVRAWAWAWRGQTVAAFVEGKGFEGSTFRLWSSRLRKKPAAPRMIVQLVPKVAEHEPATERCSTPVLTIPTTCGFGEVHRLQPQL